MDRKQQKNLIKAATELLEQKNISKDEIQEYLIEVFVKAFQKEKMTIVDEDTPLSNVKAEVDIDKGIINIKRYWIVVEKVEDEKKLLIHLPIDSELLINNSNIKVGDEFVEEINLQDITYGKAQYIKQLLIQKISESEKLKLYDQFKNKDGELLKAKVVKTDDKYTIFDYDGVSIFMPSFEYLPRDRWHEGDNVLIYVVEIKKVSKNSQVIASRKNDNFILKLLQKEIDDVMDGFIKIKSLARIPGFKTKLAVSSTQPEIDPVGSIIGPKGKRISVIIDELNGERIDVIKYNDNIKEFIADALLPAKILGISIIDPNLENNEETKKELDKNSSFDIKATVITDEENFLPALGKKGINVLLASKLTNVKIDIKKEKDAIDQEIEYEKFEYKTPINSMQYSKNNERQEEGENFELESFDMDQFEDEEHLEEYYNEDTEDLKND